MNRPTYRKFESTLQISSGWVGGLSEAGATKPERGGDWRGEEMRERGGKATGGLEGFASYILGFILPSLLNRVVNVYRPCLNDRLKNELYIWDPMHPAEQSQEVLHQVSNLFLYPDQNKD
ncbi:hypothetical protein BHM03_00040398 [Ensete ventricosum]|nr:hypothetical protein BHM03_00040398 [Ensete ventricosum]